MALARPTIASLLSAHTAMGVTSAKVLTCQLHKEEAGVVWVELTDHCFTCRMAVPWTEREHVVFQSERERSYHADLLPTACSQCLQMDASGCVQMKRLCVSDKESGVTHSLAPMASFTDAACISDTLASHAARILVIFLLLVPTVASA